MHHISFIHGDLVAQWWGCGGSVVKSTGWHKTVTQQSRVRIRLPSQPSERGQEIWLCIIKQNSG
jgi:hypothetical protein